MGPGDGGFELAVGGRSAAIHQQQSFNHNDVLQSKTDAG